MKTNLSATCLRCLCLPTFHPPPPTVSTSSWNNCASCICVRSRQSVASLLVLLSRWSGEKIDIQGNLWVYSLRCCDGDGSYSLCHSEKTVLSSHKFQENVFSFSALFDCLLSSLVAPSTTEKSFVYIFPSAPSTLTVNDEQRKWWIPIGLWSSICTSRQAITGVLLPKSLERSRPPESSSERS